MLLLNTCVEASISTLQMLKSEAYIVKNSTDFLK